MRGLRLRPERSSPLPLPQRESVFEGFLFKLRCVCPEATRVFGINPSMETDSGHRAMSRRRESAQERRERRLRAEARVRLQLCRDAVRIASHRGGDGCRRAHTDAPTQTAPVALPPAATHAATSASAPGISTRGTCTYCLLCNTSAND